MEHGKVAFLRINPLVAGLKSDSNVYATNVQSRDVKLQMPPDKKTTHHSFRPEASNFQRREVNYSAVSLLSCVDYVRTIYVIPFSSDSYKQ
jgi:hypothetical protein